MAQVSLARRAYFSAGRQLQRADWREMHNRTYYGKRARPHGHDYILDVFYTGEVSAEDGMIVNLDDLKPVLAAVTEKLDGGFLNDLGAFKERVPTLENLVNFIWSELPPRMAGGMLYRVRLQETERQWIEKNQDVMKLTRKYEFAAAHRLHSPSLSEEENARLYGKCNNPRGHGHNYGLEVTVEGAPHPQTGSIIPTDALDVIVEEEVFSRFDHRHLNDDCPEFVNLIPTSENLARVIFDTLEPRLKRAGCRLAKIGLHETQKNYFEVEAPVCPPTTKN